MLLVRSGNIPHMETSHHIQDHRGAGAGRVALWAVLVIALVVGSMFLVVGLAGDGDTRTGGFMIAVPAAIVAALCAMGLRNGR